MKKKKKKKDQYICNKIIFQQKLQHLLSNEYDQHQSSSNYIISCNYISNICQNIYDQYSCFIKRSQLYLLNIDIYQIKNQFNQKFQEIYANKARYIDEIISKTKIIKNLKHQIQQYEQYAEECCLTFQKKKKKI